MSEEKLFSGRSCGVTNVLDVGCSFGRNPLSVVDEIKAGVGGHGAIYWLWNIF